MTTRVLMVTPGFRGRPGGVEVHTSELVAGLAAQGVDVSVVTASRDVRDRTDEQFDDCRSTVYPAWRIQSMSIAPRAVVGALRRRSRADIVHVHSYHATTALAALGGRRPIVFTPHYHGTGGHTAAAGVLHRVYRHLGARILRRADVVVCVSEAERELLTTDFPFVADKVRVVPNGVRVDELRRADPFEDAGPVVLCVGRLEPYKRFDEVIRAFAEVPRPARLVMVGDGSQRAELLTLAADLGLADRIVLCGRVSDDDLRRWLRTATVLVSMSEQEAFGMVPIEAAAAGARVVLSDIPAHREIFTDYLTGCGVVVDGVTSLAEHITAQLAAGRLAAPAEVPDWPSVAGRTAGIYRQLTTPVEHPSVERISVEQIGSTDN